MEEQEKNIEIVKQELKVLFEKKLDVLEFDEEFKIICNKFKLKKELAKKYIKLLEKNEIEKIKAEEERKKLEEKKEKEKLEQAEAEIKNQERLKKEKEESEEIVILQDQRNIWINSLSKNQKLKINYLELLREKKYSEASEILVENIIDKFNIYTIKNDEKTEVWIYKEGIYMPQGKSEIKAYLREILDKSYSSFIVNQVLNKIEADTYIEEKDFFSQNYVYEVPVINGILNIKTKTLTPFTPEKIFFNKLPVEYNPEAKCPYIEKFLKDVLANAEDIKVYYEIGGWGLIKEYLFEKAIIFLGNGRNGKGKSLELLKRLFGSNNCSALPLNSLDFNSFSLYGLFGKMLNLAGDIGYEDLKQTACFKSLTGRDVIEVKRKFLPSMTFTNYSKFIFACNTLPMVYDTSKGFWGRWEILDFPYTFEPKDVFEKIKKEYEGKETEFEELKIKLRDETIIDKISTPSELSGLLNKFLEGFDRLIANNKFSTTKGTEEVKFYWIMKSNSCMSFCLEFIEESDGYITKSSFRKKYSAYCKKHKLKSKSDKVIKQTLEEEFGAGEKRILTKQLGEEGQEYVWEGVKWK